LGNPWGRVVTWQKGCIPYESGILRKVKYFSYFVDLVDLLINWGYTGDQEYLGQGHAA